MGNSSLGSMRTGEDDEALPPFLPLKGMIERQEFLDEVEEGYINISTTKNNAVEREKQVDCYIKKRKQLLLLLQKDKEYRNTCNSTKEESLSEEATYDKEDGQNEKQETLCIPPWVFDTCDIVQGLLGFSHGENVCISNLFFCQRALCYAINLQQTGLEESKNVLKTKESCDKMDSFVTIEENYMKNYEELNDIEGYDETEMQKKKPDSSEIINTAISSPTVFDSSCEEKKTFVSYEDTDSVNEKRVEQGSTNLPPLKNNIKTTTSTTVSLSKVYIKNYRRPFKKESQVLSDVARRFACIQASVTWQLQPNLLTYFKMTTPLYKLPSMMRLWMHKTVYDRCCFTLTMTLYEKQWLIFQMLCAVAQQHCIGVYHGNISLHNFVCTETDHVFLVDIASCYKPYTIPAPYAAFATLRTFYETPECQPFTSSGLRKACYLSPERFRFEPENETTEDQTVHRLENEPLTSPGFPVLCAADIYSTGCCIAEVFNEGEPTLTFSDILSLATHLRKNTDLSNQHVFPSDTMLHRVLPSRGGSSTWYLPQYCLSNLEDKRVRELVLWMCHPSVKERPTAIECLIKGREMALFPESFFSFLLPFTTLMLHPLLQSNHVVSFFMKKTLKNFEKDSKALRETDGSDVLSYSSDEDPITFYQHVALSLHELPQWNASSTRNSELFQVERPRKTTKQQPDKDVPFVEKPCEENKSTEQPWNLNENDSQVELTQHELVTKTSNIQNRVSGESLSIDNPFNCSSNNMLREALGIEESASCVMLTNRERKQVNCRIEDQKKEISNNVKALHTPCFSQMNQNSYASSFFLDFMMYWKCHFYCDSFLESFLLRKNCAARDWMQHVPMPLLTWDTGVIFSNKILKVWEEGYRLHCQLVGNQVDVWSIGENQWGIFHYPNLQILQQLHDNLQDVYCTFFVDRASTRVPCVADASRSLELSCHMYLLKLFLFKLTVKTITSKVQLNYLNCLLILLKMESFSDNVHHDMILPTLQKQFAMKHTLVIKKFLAVLTQSLQQCSIQQIPTNFLFTFMFPLFLQLLEKQRVAMRSILLTFLPSSFYILARIFSSHHLFEHADLESLRFQSLQFFRSLLLYDYEEVQLALLRSTKSLSYIFLIHELSTTLLPFLISFMNSPHATVRVAFCLCIFSIVKSFVKHLDQNKSQVLLQQTSNDFWSITSPLFPCFESALEDSDELVIEAALEGLFDALQTSLATWLKLVYTYSDPSTFFTIHEKQRWKSVGYQFIKKMVPLLYHPNRSLARTCCHVLDKIFTVFFRRDSVDKVVFFDSVLLKSPLFPIDRNSNTFWHHSTAVSRKLFYSLAYRYHATGFKKNNLNPLTLKLVTPFEQFFSQALKPMTLDTFGLLPFFSNDMKEEWKDSRLVLKEHHFSLLQIPQADPDPTLKDENDRLIKFCLSFSTESVYTSLLDCLLMDWFLYNIVSLNQLETTPNEATPTFYIPKVYKPLVRFYSEQAALKCWMYRDWRCLCFQLPHFGAGSIVREITLPHSLVSCTRSTEDTHDMSQGVRLKKTSVHLKFHPCNQCRQQHKTTQETSGGFVKMKPKRYVFLSSLTMDEAPKVLRYPLNEFLSATFILDGGCEKERVKYWYFEARHNLETCFDTHHAIGLEGEKQDKGVSYAMKTYHPEKQWEPTGTLLATCFVADKDYRTNKDTYQKRIGNVHLQLTKDSQLLVSGVENYTYNTRTCSMDSYYNTQISVYDTGRLLTQGNEARVDQLQCSKNIVPSCFSLIVQLSSILLGTHDGSLATYSLECQKYSWQTANNSISKLPFQSPQEALSNASICALTGLESSFQMVSLAGHKNGIVSYWDFRCPKASSAYRVPHWMGYPTKILSLPQETFCFTTSRGYLVTVDSRYNVILCALQTSFNNQRFSVHSLCSIRKFHAHGVCVASQAPRNDVYCLNPFTGKIDWGFLGHQESFLNYAASHLRQEECVTSTNANEFLSNEYTSVLDRSPSNKMEDPSLVLPQFQLIDARNLFSSSMSSHLGSLDMFNSYAFHSQNTKQCLWTADAIHSFNGLDSSVFSNDFILASGPDPAIRFLSLTESNKRTYIITTPHQTKNALYVPLSPVKSGSLCPSLSLASKTSSKYIFEKMFSCKPRSLESGTGLPTCSSLETFHDSPCIRKNHSDSSLFSKDKFESLKTSIYNDSTESRHLYNGHKDAITSITVAPYFKEVCMETVLGTSTHKSSSYNDNESLLFTGSRDGTIKIWQ